MRLPYFLLGLTAGVIGTLLFATDTFAATDPATEQPVLRLQKPTKSKSRCIQTMTVRRFLVCPQGKMDYAGGYTIWTACQ